MFDHGPNNSTKDNGQQNSKSHTQSLPQYQYSTRGRHSPHVVAWLVRSIFLLSRCVCPCRLFLPSSWLLAHPSWLLQHIGWPLSTCCRLACLISIPSLTILLAHPSWLRCPPCPPTTSLALQWPSPRMSPGPPWGIRPFGPRIARP
jgi:hypothetical protein